MKNKIKCPKCGNDEVWKTGKPRVKQQYKGSALIKHLAAPRGAEGPNGAFGQPSAQQRWALGHKKNNIFFVLAAWLSR